MIQIITTPINICRLCWDNVNTNNSYAILPYEYENEMS
jgi:hypothetical protein